MADENGKKSVEEWKKELEALVKEENWEALIERAFNYSIAHPNRPEGYHYEICALMGQKKFQNAIEVAERALKRNATNNTILYNYGQSLYELGRHQRAVIIFSSLIVQIDRDSKRPNYLNFRGSCYAELGKFNSAIDDFNEAIQLCESGDEPDEELLKEIYKNRGGAYREIIMTNL